MKWFFFFLFLGAGVLPAQTSAEFSQEFGHHDRWVGTVGYTQLDRNRSELALGAGAKVLETKKFSLTGKLFLERHLEREKGHHKSEHEQAKYFLRPMVEAEYKLPHHWESEAALLFRAPIQGYGHREWLLERAKLEREVGHKLKLGAGVGPWFHDSKWKHRPFVSAKKETKLGSFELWYDGVKSVRFFYELVRK